MGAVRFGGARMDGLSENNYKGGRGRREEGQMEKLCKKREKRKKAEERGQPDRRGWEKEEGKNISS